MLRWLKNLLFESTPAEFRSDYSLDESVQRLAAVTSRWALSLSQTQAVGKVSPDKVRLQRVIPMVRNSFKPFFTGTSRRGMDARSSPVTSRYQRPPESSC
jgi:hypothetical protein